MAIKSLPSQLRKLLERTVVDARAASEAAARAALVTLAVHQADAYSSLSNVDKALRQKLRIEGRRLGDKLDKVVNGDDPFPELVGEVAYEQWHRLMFARFLAENNLLIHPEAQAPVTLEECAQIADEEGKPDAWTVASEYAAAMLPGIFRNNDPVLQVRYDAAGRQSLESLLMNLPSEVFVAADSLGWVYQFWQSNKKNEVNASGRKIGGADIAPVTQLFTEHYMVEFLLHNSLGAWWASKHPDDPLVKEMEYLRFAEDGKPAAGSFSGWPAKAADIKLLDPCCGSGHFLGAAFYLLTRMRMTEEGLSVAAAGDAVLRDNLHGLELDPRCTQIGAFAVCLAAWKSGGYRKLPTPHIACSGLAVGGRVEDWISLAKHEADPKMRQALDATLRRLYRVFEHASDLGSLIDPTRVAAEEHMFAVDWDKVEPLLAKALAIETEADDPAAILGETAKGALRAALLLSGKYTLVATNVPYLGRRNQGIILRNFIEQNHAAAKADLATAFIERCLAFCALNGATALVTPQNWLFLGSYELLRRNLLVKSRWNIVALLGAGAFETIGGEVVNVALLAISNISSVDRDYFSALDASFGKDANEKSFALREIPVGSVSQRLQFNNPDARLAFDSASQGVLLSKYADSLQGISTADNPRFARSFWESSRLLTGWTWLHASTSNPRDHGGRDQIVWLSSLYIDGIALGAALRGKSAWAKNGIAINRMGDLYPSLYTGDVFDINVAVLLPKTPSNLAPIWAYCNSDDFRQSVRRLDKKAGVTNATLVKVPFDLDRWQRIADDQYPSGLPEPHSDDPTQWLFHGHPVTSTDPLQVAVARLLSYRWPEHGLPPTASGRLRQDDDGLDAYADSDGIVCIPSVTGEQTADQRLTPLLVAAYGAKWLPSLLEDLLVKAAFGGKGLTSWLRDGFFASHCKLFHQRPFIWQIWDGEKDGFSALVNYHKLDRRNLDRLIFTYLGDWIERQRADDNAAVPGAGRRLKAALDLQSKLKEIAEGEPPYDIYVRWKPLHTQAIGWEPDLNDGVRMNIRPFVTAGVLRGRVNVNWSKDRGANPDGSERLNDLHFTRAQKEEARRNPPKEANAASAKQTATLGL